MSPRPGPRKAPDVFRLTDEQRLKLQAEAARRGVSTAQVIRDYADSLPDASEGPS